ncbi:DUF2024 family protein [Arenibacter sp. F20364]|uniref:DUF2024 family protein n=1 Tax=Arenibacter sp. F20364 TaxID=2926415 RepID=UPI001FF54925|nr:DUF2024 family protein [Arenibacter sp. F20364]MCK0189860.1 DUF2024 family protein [Arenibacter sp. F20364]
MKISVWDTYVTRKDGTIMHFDILVPNNLEDEHTIFNYGREFLTGKPFNTKGISSTQCSFCHMEQANDAISAAINKRGYYIIEMENCQ